MCHLILCTGLTSCRWACLISKLHVVTNGSGASFAAVATGSNVYEMTNLLLLIVSTHSCVTATAVGVVDLPSSAPIAPINQASSQGSVSPLDPFSHRAAFMLMVSGRDGFSAGCRADHRVAVSPCVVSGAFGRPPVCQRRSSAVESRGKRNRVCAWSRSKPSVSSD